MTYNFILFSDDKKDASVEAQLQDLLNSVNKGKNKSVILIVKLF